MKTEIKLKMAGQGLSPICYMPEPEVNETPQHLTGVLESVKESETKYGESIFYTVALTQPYDSIDQSGKVKTYGEKETVTILGSGHLDFLFSTVATELGLKEVTELKSIYIDLVRKPDSKMPKGKFKGKKVKCFELGWSEELPS